MNYFGSSVKAVRKASTHLTEEPYLFYDPGTGSEIKGRSDENILTLNQVDYSLRGTTKYSTTKKYVVTQIRRN